MSSRFTLRPGVFFNWFDQATVPTSISTSIGAITGQSDRGPLLPTPVNGNDEAVMYYGSGNSTRSFLHETTRAFFRTAEAAYIVRVPGQGAMYSVAQVANNYVMGAVTALVPTGLYPDSTSVLQMAGSAETHETINRDSVDIMFSTDFIAGTSFSVEVNGTVVTVPFTVDHYATMRAIAQAIQTVVDGLGALGTVKVIERSGYLASNPAAVLSRTIRVIGPQNVDLAIDTAIFAGVGAPTAVIQDTEWLGYVLAENPGDWGSNLAIKFEELDAGRSQVVRLLWASVMDPLHTVSYTINGITQSVPAQASSNTLLNAVVASINTNVPNVTATVTVVAGVNQYREILIKGANPTIGITVSMIQVHQNAAVLAAPSVTVRTTNNAFIPDEDFAMSVYEYPNLRVPVNTYRATFQEKQDASGTQTNLAFQVNSSGARSRYIRMYANPLAVTNSWKAFSATNVNYLTGEGFLGGGVNGVLPTSADVIEGWNLLEDTTKYTVRILMNAGYTTPEVHTAITMLCEKRRDCVGILDLASQYQTTRDAAIQARYDSNIDSSYVSMFTPDIQIYDTVSRINRYSPPSGYMGALYALTDRTRKEHWSPAGLNRGHIPEARGLRYYYKDGDISELAKVQLNPIINYKGRGHYLWGDYTMQYRASPLQFIGTRRMCNSIEIIAVDTVAYSLFEPNTKATRREIVRVSENILQEYYDSQGISKFKVVDLTKPYHIDNRQAYIRYIITPITSIHQIIIDGYLTRESSDFQEYLTDTPQGNGGGL